MRSDGDGSRARRASAWALLLVVVLGTAGHLEPWEFAPPGLHASDHHHGPSGSCPKVASHHCIACAAHLLAPPRAHARLLPPQLRRAEASRRRFAAAFRPAEIRAGRSPPAPAALPGTTSA